ncbi:MAG: hypothetical protein HOG49_15920, partial [Candidatus Scalindua sp.]|nr:hypothetical protein [Candidatus Scalindua sp.]
MAILSPMITVLLIVVAAVGIGAFFLSSKKEREVRNSSGNDSNPFVHGSYNQPQRAEPVVKEVQPEPAKKEEPVYKPAQEKAFDRPAMDPSPHKASPEPVRPEPVPLKQEEPARQVSEPDLVQVVVPVE